MKRQATLNEILTKLRTYLPELSKEYNIKSLGVFGSYVRGEQKKNSDLDVLIEFHKTPGLFKYVGLQDEISDLLGMKVDLVSKKALKPVIGEHILNEVIYL